MNKSTPSSITAEEAVARMVNAAIIPDGSSLNEMLSADTDNAEIEYENAKHDQLPEEQIESLMTNLKVCKARRLLAHFLLEDIHHEFYSTEESILVTSKDITSKTRYTLESFAMWAVLKHSIVIYEWLDHCKSLSKWLLPPDITWEDIEIRIRKSNMIAYFYKDNEWENRAFSDINLLSMKTLEPNYQAGILIGLSLGDKFPPTRIANAKSKTSISKLRTSLKKLIGIKTDPFHPFNETDGWKPRFKITNDIKIADKRAEDNAQHIGFDDARGDGIDVDDRD